MEAQQSAVERIRSFERQPFVELTLRSASQLGHRAGDAFKKVPRPAVLVQIDRPGQRPYLNNDRHIGIRQSDIYAQIEHAVSCRVPACFDGFIHDRSLSEGAFHFQPKAPRMVSSVFGKCWIGFESLRSSANLPVGATPLTSEAVTRFTGWRSGLSSARPLKSPFCGFDNRESSANCDNTKPANPVALVRWYDEKRGSEAEAPMRRTQMRRISAERTATELPATLPPALLFSAI